MSRRLPLIAAPSQAPLAPAGARPLDVDLRCVALVCEPGFDACAAWLEAFRARYTELAGPAVPVGWCSAVVPLASASLALVAELVQLAPEAAPSAFSGSPRWLLVTDAGFRPSGARVVVHLCDPMGARRPADDLARHVFLARDRLATARALAVALAASLSPTA